MNKALLPIILRGRKDIRSTLLGYNPSVMFMQDDASGTVAVEDVHGYDGAYTGVDLAQDKEPFTCPFYDGVNDFCNIYTAGLNSIKNFSAFSAVIFTRVYDASVWSDGALRRPLSLVTVGSQDVVSMNKGNAAGYVGFNLTLGAATENIAVSGYSETDWMLWALTVSTAADEFKGFINDAQAGSTQTGLGTPSGNVILGQYACIGSYNTTPANQWHGWLGPLLFWFGTVLSLSDIQQIYGDILG